MSNSLKLMIVDDSLVIRNKINRALARLFPRIVRARNGQEAVEMLKTENPDVVTMDLTMPEMDGVSCIQSIKKLKPETHILVVSALADKSTAIAAMTYGANGFLCKPFDGEQLADAIGKILNIKL